MVRVGDYEVPEVILVKNRFTGREEAARFLSATKDYVIYVGVITGTKYRYTVREASFKTPYKP